MERQLITTTKGLMDPEDLERREGGHENDDEVVRWVEFWDGEDLVHRSARVHLKKPVIAFGAAANF